jgi:hypothetical protein
MEGSMNTFWGFVLTIVLFTLFSIVLSALFHTLLMIFIAGIATAIVGIVIEHSLGAKKA